MSEGGNFSQIALVVACALVDAQGRVLLQKRPAGKPMAGLWEFPGGKVEPGETPEEALAREIAEELGVMVEAPTAAAFASAPLGERHLVLLLYVCRRWTGSLLATEGQALQWASIADMRKLCMPPADEPLIALLERLL